MITRSNRNTKNNKLTLTSRTFLLTALAAALLNPAAYAQTNSSSGINRRTAQHTARTSASSQKSTAAAAPVTSRAKASVKKAASAPRPRQTSSQRAVKITIQGNRNDIRRARQQGMQSLQDANAAIAARNAEREAAATAAAMEANAAREAAAMAQNSFQQPGSTYGYGFVPGFGNPIASYGYGNGLYGSTSTTQPVIVGATPYGAPTQTFPSFYTNYSPGIYSSYSSFGSINPFGF